MKIESKQIIENDIDTINFYLGGGKASGPDYAIGTVTQVRRKNQVKHLGKKILKNVQR